MPLLKIFCARRFGDSLGIHRNSHLSNINPQMFFPRENPHIETIGQETGRLRPDIIEAMSDSPIKTAKFRTLEEKLKDDNNV